MGFLDNVLGRKGPAPKRQSDDDLFDDEFQRKLDYLALVSKKVFAGRMRAERRTKKSGSGVEFADHRDYQPGDDAFKLANSWSGVAAKSPGFRDQASVGRFQWAAISPIDVSDQRASDR